MEVIRSGLRSLIFFVVGTSFIFARAQLTEVAELTASDGAKNDAFGIAVALSGSTAVIGAQSASRNGGAAYVFENVGGKWMQVAKLTASDTSRNQLLGTSVAISGDGSTIVAGAPGSPFKQGAVYVFVKPQSGWVDMTETGKLTVNRRTASFGAHTAISGDGAKVVSVSSSSGGFVFVKPPGGWASMTQATAALEVASGGASAAAISGKIVALGVNGFNGSNGAVLVYVVERGFLAPVIQPTATLTGSDETCATLGFSLAMNSDTIATGSVSVAPGSVCVFTKPPSGWMNMTQSAELSVLSMVQFALGASVTISGHMVAAGAPGAQANGHGAFYGYSEPPSGWVNTTTPNLFRTSSDGAEFDDFGWSIVASGKTVLVGAPFHAVNGNAGQGAAYVFQPK